MKPQEVRVGETTKASASLGRRRSLADASLVAQARQWLPLGYRQVSTGHFNGLIESIDLAGIELIHEQHDQAVSKTGCTPSGYLRIARLNGARAELISSSRGETSLTAIATRWGFLHIGRFTKDYRRLSTNRRRQRLPMR
jgi:hypothetical protein